MGCSTGFIWFSDLKDEDYMPTFWSGQNRLQVIVIQTAKLLI